MTRTPCAPAATKARASAAVTSWSARAWFRRRPLRPGRRHARGPERTGTQRQRVRRGRGGLALPAPAAKLNEAISLAAELGGPQARLIVVTDHAPNKEIEPGRLQWHAFGQPRANRAIVRAGRSPGEKTDRISLEIANFAAAPQTFALALEAGNLEAAAGKQPVHREVLTLAPKEFQRLAFQIPRDTPPVAARLDADALALDDVAYLVREEAPPIRIQVQIADAALKELVDKTLAATGRMAPASAKPQLIVTDSLEPADLPLETWLLQIIQEKEADSYVGPFVLDKTHPLTEGLSLQGVAWGAGKSDQEAGNPVILAGNVVLVSDAEGFGGQHRLRLRLRPELSTLTESPAWPVLWWNLLHWRGAELPGCAARTCGSGSRRSCRCRSARRR